MSVLSVIKYPNPILRNKSQGISDVSTKEMKQLILDMGETMKKNVGVGLAAPQVGKNVRLFVVNTKDGVLPWFNAKIVSKSLKKEISEEGCLSIPKVYGDVKRHTRIKVKAQDIDGKTVIFSAQGLYARVIQHEIDHIDGVLFIDRVDKLNKGQEILEKYGQKK